MINLVGESQCCWLLFIFPTGIPLFERKFHLGICLEANKPWSVVVGPQMVCFESHLLVGNWYVTFRECAIFS